MAKATHNAALCARWILLARRRSIPVRVAVAVSWTVIHAWQVDDLPVSYSSFGDDVVG
jgi:hypothetical protein